MRFRLLAVAIALACAARIAHANPWTAYDQGITDSAEQAGADPPAELDRRISVLLAAIRQAEDKITDPAAMLLAQIGQRVPNDPTYLFLVESQRKAADYLWWSGYNLDAAKVQLIVALAILEHGDPFAAADKMVAAHLLFMVARQDAIAARPHLMALQPLLEP